MASTDEYQQSQFWEKPKTWLQQQEEQFMDQWKKDETEILDAYYKVTKKYYLYIQSKIEL